LRIFPARPATRAVGREPPIDHGHGGGGGAVPATIVVGRRWASARSVDVPAIPAPAPAGSDRSRVGSRLRPATAGFVRKGDRSVHDTRTREQQMSSTRVQLALNVADLAQATDFYSRLFGVGPHKVHDGYANFAIPDPPLKLVLIENPNAPEALNHIGVEAPTADDVTAALARFRAAGLATTVAEDDRCCHAVQQKLFVTASDVPHGWWEYYSVTDDDPDGPDDATVSACEVRCAADDTTDSVCCG
jgi:catechol 2,3-dioxygenase-like lactoylglutathione lyase family enzyme